MVERLLILKDDLNNEVDKTDRLIKAQSFNTDDDDSLTAGDLQQIEEDNTSKSNDNLLRVDESKRTLLSLNSPSFDSIMDPEGSISDIPISEKSKKKKRRTMEKIDNTDHRRSSIKQRPWYTRVDVTKPILFLAFLFLIYLMWVKRDVWIPRLLTSNSRVRVTALKREEKLNGQKDLSSTKNSSSLSSNQDEIINDENNNNEQSSLEDNDDDDSPTISNKQTSQKLNIRVRRNKMSFTRDRTTKKSRNSKNKIIDDDNDDGDEEEDEDNEDDENNDQDSIQSTETILPSSIHSSKKHRHRHRSDQTHEHKTKISTNGKTGVIVRPYDDIVEQLKTLMKSHGKNKDLLTTLMKETGLNKAKINRFIQQKDLSVITLDILISFLDSLDSTILIVSK